jgi:hypothetical protein
MTVAERIKGTFENAKAQVNGFEKQVEKEVKKLEKRAKAQLTEVKGQIDEVPTQLKGAWETVVARLRNALAFATKEELSVVQDKLEELSKKVEKLVRGDKIRAAAGGKPTGKKS